MSTYGVIDARMTGMSGMSSASATYKTTSSHWSLSPSWVISFVLPYACVTYVIMKSCLMCNEIWVDCHLTLELPRGGGYHPSVFSKRHIFSVQIFQKRFRIPLGYSLPHLLVNKFQENFAPRSVCIEKSEVPRGVVTTPLDLSSYTR